MASLKDIAARCGVSVATVSKALNNHRDIGEKTKENIRQVAKEMGYFPNSAAQALKTNRTYNIGVLFVDEAMSGLTHDYFSHVLDSFKKTAEQQGYDITFINCCKTRKNKMSYLDHARYRGFDGVVIACIEFTDPDVQELIDSEIPVVTIDHLFSNRIAIMSDNVTGMSDLLTYIYERGHRKIAYIYGESSAKSASVTQARVSSFYRTAEKLGLTIPDEYMLESNYRSTTASYKATNYMLDLPNRPTCILYPDDFAAFGGIKAIKERGLKIPDDISIAGYDGIPITRRVSPKLTTLRQDSTAIGAKAAEALISLIEKPKATVIEPISVGGELYEGETVSDINSKTIYREETKI